MAEFNETLIRDENDFVLKTILSVSTGCLCPLILLGNLLVIIPFIQSHRVRTPSNHLILYLAIVDLTFGIIMPFSCFLHNKEVFQRVFEGIQLGVSIASFSFMVSIALDKAFSIAKPLRYTSVMTKINIQIYSVTLGLIAIATAVSLMCFIPSDEKDFQILILGILLIPCVILVSASYFYIYSVASKHIQAMRQVEVSVRSKERRDRLVLKSTNNNYCYQSSIEEHHSIFSSKKLSKKKNKRNYFKTKMPPSSRYGVNLSLTVVLLLGSRLPGPLGTLLLGNYTGVLIRVLDVPLYLCSAFNPWVYAYHNLELKKLMRRLMRKMKKRLCCSCCSMDPLSSISSHNSKTSKKTSEIEDFSSLQLF
ncbi:LOW QUALITY PROTEIN: alpha-2A adrenergic receptor [Lepeophtheirus salmonis]|uniref:LOW QUALITY PROTEIN: alpha-2A adrenergic receptor n=1 Tax=Lepeophtheirus salmonis TaxID=72036 RepID=UPI001AEA6451|nr:LOW QUALITY PROTEIN: alpha-1B adrenergic receptor-like [Lepeophtheirus salmonis]